MNRIKMNKVIGGKRYDTEKAELIADDVYWDGHNFERSGRNQWLYKTHNNRYFTVCGTFWQGERDSLEVLTQEEAQEAWETYLPEHYVKFEEAFPNVKVEDA